ncbi:MAG: heme ABC exporter ATP-binding protein CcmA [Gemmatimonadota bacterium]
MPLPEAPLLEARGLVRRYGRNTVLAGLDLTLQPGEALLVLGPNGAGKSTLLRLLAGLARPDGGWVRIGGSPVADARGRLGYLAHETFLYDDLTVQENLVFAARLYGRADRVAIATALEAGGLTAQRDRLVRHLSRGQAQRAALIRSLLHGPDLLLLDEPYTGLDAAGAAALTGSLQRATGAGRAVVIVEHHPEQGWEAVTRIAALARGRWVLEAPRPATPLEATTRYREALNG